MGQLPSVSSADGPDPSFGKHASDQLSLDLGPHSTLVVLSWASLPPGHIWQHLEAVFVVTTRGRGSADNSFI